MTVLAKYSKVKATWIAVVLLAALCYFYAMPSMSGGLEAYQASSRRAWLWPFVATVLAPLYVHYLLKFVGNFRRWGGAAIFVDGGTITFIGFGARSYDIEDLTTAEAAKYAKVKLTRLSGEVVSWTVLAVEGTPFSIAERIEAAIAARQQRRGAAAATSTQS